ncbi:MAG: FAD-dependent oxidoreductase [Verrucomicrobiales bacterium]|nr:FAD-dependent oxidoreductase [Verrucomicrobiales bacterium]
MSARPGTRARGPSRRRFIGSTLGAGLVASLGGAWSQSVHAAEAGQATERSADVVILGGGLGGVAAALAACRSGLRVILTEETDWLGGQLTAQGVPPDEHRWIEQFGGTRTYRSLRDGIRDYYRRHYPLTAEARARWNLNPGNGSVSRLCHEPRVAVAVLESMILPYLSRGLLTVMREHRLVSADATGDRASAVTVRALRSGRNVVLRAPWFVDATELGDLLPLAGVEHVTGAEGRATTGEMHAPEKTDPANQQAFTACFAIDYVAGENHTIDRPRDWLFWRDYVPNLRPAWPGRLLAWDYTHPRTLEVRTPGFSPDAAIPAQGFNLWHYRRLMDASNFQAGTYRGDVSLINWPHNDYLLGNLVGVTEAEAARHVEQAKQLSLSLLYWMQTEAPRPDGGQGWLGLRLRPDVLGTEDGLAKVPYIREGRRIRAQYTIVESDLGLAARAERLGGKPGEITSEIYRDSVGIGHYAIDLHPSTAGDNYVDFDALPFHLPLGALLPIRVENVLPACKNIGTTHVTNGAYRLHPVEWNIGESVGALVAFASRKKEPVRAIRERPELLAEFQGGLRDQGIETHWPNVWK